MREGTRRVRRVDAQLVEDLLGVSAWARQDLSWMDFGLCKEVDPDLFFPVAQDEYGKDNGAAGHAKSVCLGNPERGVAPCPVLNTCRDYATYHPDRLDGVWGGTTKNERSEIRYRNRKDRAVIREAS